MSYKKVTVAPSESNATKAQCLLKSREQHYTKAIRKKQQHQSTKTIQKSTVCQVTALTVYWSVLSTARLPFSTTCFWLALLVSIRKRLGAWSSPMMRRFTTLNGLCKKKSRWVISLPLFVVAYLNVCRQKCANSGMKCASTHAHAHTHALMHARNTHTHAFTHAQACTHTHTHICAHTHTHICAHTHTHTHAQTHKGKKPNPKSLPECQGLRQ